MSQTVRQARRMASALGMLVLTVSTIQAAPLIDTGPYSVTLSGAGRYAVSGKVETGGAGYIYTYTVARLGRFSGIARHIELGIAEDPAHAGLHAVTNASVSSGPGSLTYDLAPHSSMATSGHHNYVWTHLQGGLRTGIAIQGQEVQQMSFESTCAPVLADWSFRELFARNGSFTSQFINNKQLGLGELPVPGSPLPACAPEPSSLALAALGIASAGLAGWRRKRRAIQDDQPA